MMKEKLVDMHKIRFTLLGLMIIATLVTVNIACTSNVDELIVTNEAAPFSTETEIPSVTPDVTVIATETIQPPTYTPTPEPISTIVNTPTPELAPTSESDIPPNITKAVLFPSNMLLWDVITDEVIDGYSLGASLSSRPWSPDGRQIAYRQTEDGQLAIFTPETDDIIHLDLGNEGSPPLWSPNGQFLTYIVPTENQYLNKIIVVDILSRQTLYESDPVTLISFPGWSPDSDNIAYIRRVNGTVESGEGSSALEIFNLLQGQTKQFQSPESHYWLSASWSPTENRLLLYGSDRSFGLPEPGWPIGLYELLNLVDPVSGISEKLRELPRYTSSTEENSNALKEGYYISIAPWSPDGKNIIYSVGGDICLFSIEERQEICPEEVNAVIDELDTRGGIYPSISPSGKWIGLLLESKDIAGGFGALIRMDGSEVRVSEAYSASGPIWPPYVIGD